MPGFVLALGGLPGAGKSTVARLLAPGLRAVVVRSDEIRKRQHGVAPLTRLGAEAYTPAASARVFAELAARVRAARERGVIADATFMNPAHRALVRDAAGEAPFLGVWLMAPADVLRARVAARVDDASDAGLAVLESALAADPGPGEWLAVDCRDGARAAAAVLAALGRA